MRAGIVFAMALVFAASVARAETNIYFVNYEFLDYNEQPWVGDFSITYEWGADHVTIPVQSDFLHGMEFEGRPYPEGHYVDTVSLPPGARVKAVVVRDGTRMQGSATFTVPADAEGALYVTVSMDAKERTVEASSEREAINTITNSSHWEVGAEVGADIMGVVEAKATSAYGQESGSSASEGRREGQKTSYQVRYPGRKLNVKVN